MKMVFCLKSLATFLDRHLADILIYIEKDTVDNGHGILIVRMSEG